MVMQVFANMLIERDVKGASIINISSIVGKYGNIGQANYSASKAGVVTLTKTASKEFGKFGIRCNCILPGFINTPMTKLVPDKVIQKILPHIPSGRFGEANGKLLFFFSLLLNQYPSNWFHLFFFYRNC